ncbi:hypothetical protein KFL_005200030 [Klebsormidium nitens]|uniref:carnosine N-methyltransferase n=1 Tax=Klebsormidium nitens TaxID=105231 RepID=A0A1Y1IH74_KLENI|nr:hypothetical protein KFL_005200030 [Klebsormidium nitens]|eukprot:GAQ89422.1 hypothetical protein KFL_005200030 [Klebsormidium nitens]
MEAAEATALNGRSGREEQDFSDIDRAEEMKSLQRVLDAYIEYRGSVEDDIIRWERSYHHLTPPHRALVPELPSKYTALRRCADQNALLIDAMLQSFDAPFQSRQAEDPWTATAVPQPEATVTEKSTDGGDQVAGGALERTSQGNGPIEAVRWSGQKRSRPETSASEPTPREVGQKLGPADQRSLDHSEEAASGDVDLGPWETSGIGVNGNRGGEPVHSQNVAGAGREPEPVRTQGGVSVVEGRELVHIPGRTRGYGDSEPVHTHAGMEAYGEGRPVHTHTNGLPYAWGDGQATEDFHRRVPPSDVEKVRCVLRNIVRDWTSEGAAERSACYGPILAELRSCFPEGNSGSAQPLSCVVPGAGLARLACEISRLGFEVQGNEFSYYTLIVSSFILNMTDQAHEWTFYPYIHSQCNTRRDDDMLRPVTLPDLHPGSAGITDGFSMCAGDFLEVYGGRHQAGAWDSVVTCFFIDTAHNVIAYLEVIARILKPGGVWINFGPLLYHFADAHQYSQDDELSVELSLETILRIARSFGLKLKREPQFVSTTYTSNPRSMMTTRYNCAFWTMIKD